MSIGVIPFLDKIVARALEEDIGSGDITTQLTVPDDVRGDGRIVFRSAGVVAGLPVVEEVYRQVDPRVGLLVLSGDGSTVGEGAEAARLQGPASGILTGERVALNFLQRMSGIATLTSRFVALAEGARARIVDTRKTTPGLRALEKYAVRMGGGFNHRFGLYDAVLIKDNHIAVAGSVTQAVQNAFAGAPHTMTVTVECDNLDQVQEAVAAGADIVLLDNMTTQDLYRAVDMVDGQAAIEVSGGVNEQTVAEIARTGVDIISIGALTHSAPALDIGLDLITAE